MKNLRELCLSVGREIDFALAESDGGFTPNAINALRRASSSIDDELPYAEHEVAVYRAENDRLRAVLTVIADGKARMTPRAEKCEHGAYGYESCEACISSFARRLMAGLARDKISVCGTDFAPIGRIVMGGPTSVPALLLRDGVTVFQGAPVYARPMSELIRDQHWVSLAASLYQACGAYDMPVAVLDALSPAANNEPFDHLIDAILPCFPPDAVGDESSHASPTSGPSSHTLICPTCGADRLKQDCQGDRMKCGIQAVAQGSAVPVAPGPQRNQFDLFRRVEIESPQSLEVSVSRELTSDNDGAQS